MGDAEKIEVRVTNDGKRVVLSLDKEEAIALAGLASFAVTCLVADPKKARETMRKGFSIANLALQRLGAVRWSALQKRLMEQSLEQWPTLGVVTGRISGKTGDVAELRDDLKNPPS